jgi:hypothetical protein
MIGYPQFFFKQNYAVYSLYCSLCIYTHTRYPQSYPFLIWCRSHAFKNAQGVGGRTQAELLSSFRHRLGACLVPRRNPWSHGIPWAHGHLKWLGHVRTVSLLPSCVPRAISGETWNWPFFFTQFPGFFGEVGHQSQNWMKGRNYRLTWFYPFPMFLVQNQGFLILYSKSWLAGQPLRLPHGSCKSPACHKHQRLGILGASCAVLVFRIDSMVFT